MGMTMMDRLHRAKAEGIQIGEQFGEQLSVDLMQIALHRHGWGYDRVRKLMEEITNVSNYYDPAFHVNPEQEVWQERMDAELRDIVKDRDDFIPFALRYPNIRQLCGKAQKGVTPIEYKEAAE